MVKKKAKKADSEPDYEAIGRRIAEAVALPLADGITFHDIGKYSVKSIAAVEYYASEKYRADYDLDALANEIAIKADELKKAIEDYSTKHIDNFDDLISYAESIRHKFCRLAPMGGLSLTAKETPRGAKQMVHHFLQSYFRNFFGVDASYTYKEGEGYAGPFMRYIRAVRDTVGLDITDAGIAKSLQRTRAKYKRNLQETTPTNDVKGASAKVGASKVKGQFRGGS